MPAKSSCTRSNILCAVKVRDRVRIRVSTVLPRLLKF